MSVHCGGPQAGIDADEESDIALDAINLLRNTVGDEQGILLVNSPFQQRLHSLEHRIGLGRQFLALQRHGGLE